MILIQDEKEASFFFVIISRKKISAWNVLQLLFQFAPSLYILSVNITQVTCGTEFEYSQQSSSRSFSSGTCQEINVGMMKKYN